MTLDDLEQQLATMANCGDPTFAQAAQYISDATQAAKAGQLAPADLAELLRDTQRQLDIVQDMNQLAYKETLNTIINGLLTIAAAY
jgi:hypothetical protein